MPPDRLGGEADRGPIRSEPGSLLEHVAVAVFGIDDEDRVCYWGPGARYLFGHEAEEVLSRPAAALFPAQDTGAAQALTERARTLGYWRVRLPALHRDGTVFDCGFRVFPVTGAEGGSVVMALASRGVELDRVKTNLVFLDALFETCPIGLVMLDEELRYVHLNQALADMDGIPLADHLGRHMADIMITSDDGAYQRMLRGVADEGRPVVGALVGLRTPGHPDRDQVRSVSFFPLSGVGDTRRGVGGLLVDVTDRELAIVEATAARQRLALLDRAAARIGTTLDLNTTARELVEAVVPDFCDGSVVELVEWMDESAEFDPSLPLFTRRIAAGTTLAAPAVELVSGLEQVRYPPGSSIHQMLSTGRPLWVPVNEEFVTRTVIHQERAQLLLDSGLACILIAPLIARGTVQGITMFGRSAARPAFTEQDLSLASELASRAALCLDNARLYSRVQDIALTLQRALLPNAPAAGPYVDIAHRYLPGSRVTEVGGDWYDVIHLPGDRVALVVGDVMGHGVPAAAAMGRLRITAKTLARHTRDPGAVLAELDACAQEAGIELATCLYILYDPHTGRARIASAGHPPPLIRHEDGRTVDTIGDVLGVPLGVGGVAFESIEAEIPEGATVALYTDGLIEARGQDIDTGMDALREQLRGPLGSLEEAADRILSNLLPDTATDDTVLVLARVRRAGDGAQDHAE
ncbi:MULTISPECIES: SpoIIE family protein phosphatase [unclassified Streptomyces]|uniref:SpoIIE family protein phosphatase n=1 Tax=unclassified Streptomyces TaxID=2593676 RepID=UPI001BE6D6AC|nr:MULTISPECIES: SpoIIE family protein phosphatase [unclassified Streptomyces]MBT2407797.1 SpoIIE family protein phosphatase [Streptomyces sp. ISL-21]MBT2456728.1 SpoIIE family protein phosphatase [Streptomyces sp. ISL-86]MBT2608513.1 SpoIIE family protein phosphatase [Streptomyces sp. ISL-87]